MNINLDNNPKDKERWEFDTLPLYEVNQEVFSDFMKAGGYRKQVLNCSVTSERANQLVQFEMPQNWDFDKCMHGSWGKLEPGLEKWDYQGHMHPQKHLPYFKNLPADYKNLTKSPWTHYPSKSGGPAINTRLLRHNHQLWQDLRPKTLRGVFTTLVLVSPQVGFSLAPHIQIEPVFNVFAALSRAGGPCQMMPASYLYPDAQIQGMESTPATMFADILPHVGGDAFPVMECTPNPWGEIARYDIRNYYYGYPFAALNNSSEDVTLNNFIRGGTILPNGKSVMASSSKSYLYATLDDQLRHDLMLSRNDFMRKHGLVRGTVTHDGLPFQIPPEMQANVFAVCLTSWELEMKHPGDLTSYILKTQHAAIRSYHFYQQMEPFYGNFMRLLHELEKQSTFKTYLLSNHLTNYWLGENLRIPNQLTWLEQKHGARFIRNIYRQQLDWMMGVVNSWNQVSFRNQPAFRNQSNLEGALPFDGVVFHQMRKFFTGASFLFNRPIKNASPWPGMSPLWTQYDKDLEAGNLPTPAFER